MRVGVLGPLVVTSAVGTALAIPTAAGPQMVLEWLALRAGVVVRAETLAAALWGVQPPRAAAKTIQMYVSVLRKALPPGVIETTAGGYRLGIQPSAVDAHRFERLVRDGHAALAAERFGEAAAGLAEALGLWRGAPVAELVHQPAGRVEADRLEELRRAAEEDLAEARLALGEHVLLMAGLEAAVADEPLRERRWGQLMLALYRCGRQADALAAFGRLRTLLDDELGLEPASSLGALQAAILRQDPALDPPPRTTTAARPAPVPRELPADVDGFTGRETELAELDWLLPAVAVSGEGAVPGRMAISVLSGMAGAGKTALAVRWAHRVAGSFPDGQLYVNLRGYDPDQPVLATEALAGFLRALGAAGANVPLEEAERAARYRSLLAGKRVLVVLDNAASAEQVRPLLPGTPSAMVIVTSRDVLAGLVAREGARRMAVDVLPRRDATALLCVLIGPRAEVDAAATAALADRCARLPLALRVAAELAVARPDASLSGLVGELAGQQERLQLLNAGGDPRAAVASVFSWSYRHLPADAAGMFRLLGLHPGADWDRYAGAALAGTTLAQAGQLLDTLACAHLIQPAGAGRYSLHDLLRAYAAGLSADHDDDQARRTALTRLFDYYLAACAMAMDQLAPADRRHRPDPEPVGTPLPGLDDHAAGTAWLDRERATLIDVTAYTAAHGWPAHAIALADTLVRYFYGGHHTEGITMHTHALNAARDEDDRGAQARMLTHLGVHHYHQGRYQQAADCHQRSLALAIIVGDRFTQGRARGNLGVLQCSQGRYEQAVRSFQQNLALFQELGERLTVARTLTDLGSCHLALGRSQRGISYLARALVESRQIGSRQIEVYALLTLGEAFYHQGRYQRATEQQQRVLALGREIGYKASQAIALVTLSRICHRQGNDDQAAEHGRHSLTLLRDMGNRQAEAEALNATGEALLAIGQPEQAWDCHATALVIAGDLGNRLGQAYALTGLAEVCRHRGEFEEAVRYSEQAIDVYQETDAREGLASALNGAGETLLATGQSGQAYECHTTALTVARQTVDRYQQARAYQGLADAGNAIGDLSRARQHRQRARDIYRDLGVPLPTWLEAPTQQNPMQAGETPSATAR